MATDPRPPVRTTDRAPGSEHAERGRPRTRRAVGRALAVLAVLAVWLLVGSLGGMAQGTLSEVQENDSAAFLPEGAESTRAGELASGFSDSSTLPGLVVVEAEGGGPLDGDQLAAVQELAAAVPAIELADGSVLAESLTGPVVAIPSEDGAAALVPVPIDAERADQIVGGGEERLVGAAVEGVRELVAERLDDTGLAGWVTGPAGAIADLVTAFGGIDGVLLLVALAVVLVILVAVYRSPSLPFTVLLTAVFGLAAAALVVKPLADEGVLLLNGQSQGILSILVVGAATDYSLLLVARYREELHRHRDPFAAMRVAWRATLEPILASAGTVIVGLLCLLLSDLGSNSSLGPVAAIGIAASVLAALTLLPALLLVAGRRARFVFWPRMPRYGEGLDPAERAGLWERVSGFVGRHARAVWVVTALVLVGAAAFVPTLRAEGTDDFDVFLEETESVTGQEALARHFPAGQVLPVVVITDEEHAEEVLAAASGVDGVTSATLVTEGSGQAGPPGGAPGGPGVPDAEPLVVDGRVQVQAITEAGAETQEAVGTVRDVRAAVHDVDPDALVGGSAAQRLDTQETAARDLRTIIPVVLLAIFVMLVLLLRALVAPLVLLVANVLSFAATMGVSAIVFNHVLDLPGADLTVPLYGFVFLVALGIDYSIFLMTRVREESLSHGTRPGVRRGLAVTGGVITSAGLVLAATFSALAVIPLLFLLQMAFIVAFGVLLDTLVVRSLLVPGAIHDLGRRAWWPWQRRVPADTAG